MSYNSKNTVFNRTNANKYNQSTSPPDDLPNTTRYNYHPKNNRRKNYPSIQNKNNNQQHLSCMRAHTQNRRVAQGGRRSEAFKVQYREAFLFVFPKQRAPKGNYVTQMLCNSIQRYAVRTENDTWYLEYDSDNLPRIRLALS